MTNLGLNLFQQAKWTAAEPLLRTAVEQARKQFGPEDSRTAGILAALGLTLIEQSKWTEAEPVSARSAFS